MASKKQPSTRRVPLEVVVTRKYHTGYRYLEQIEDAGWMKITQRRPVIRSESDLACLYDDSTEYELAATVDPATYAKLKRLWREHAPRLEERVQEGARQFRQPFRSWVRCTIGSMFDLGCQCEHDCCGHYFGHGMAYPTRKKRTFMVRYTRSRNV